MEKPCALPGLSPVSVPCETSDAPFAIVTSAILPSPVEMQFTTPPVAVSAAPASSVSEPSTARRKIVASAASVSVSPAPIVHSPPSVGTARAVPAAHTRSAATATRITLFFMSVSSL